MEDNRIDEPLERIWASVPASFKAQLETAARRNNISLSAYVAQAVTRGHLFFRGAERITHAERAIIEGR